MGFFKTKKGSVLIIAVCILAVTLVFLVILLTNRNRSVNGIFYCMDTFVETIGDDDVKDGVKDIFEQYDRIFDMHNDNSELSTLNFSGNITASDELSNAVKRCVSLCEKYGNDADISIGAITKLWGITGDSPKVPSDDEIKKALGTVGYKNIGISGNNITLSNGAQLDMGCCAKGAALDAVRDMLDSKYGNDKSKTIVSAGSSSILLYGDESFKTAVLSPESDSETVGTLKTDQGFISTSGGYHRFTEIDGVKYQHIFDTKTGKPSETDLTSVTVFCQSGIDSDMLSTMIFAGGTKKIDEYLKNKDIQIVAIDNENNVYVSDGAVFTINDEDKYKIAEK